MKALIFALSFFALNASAEPATFFGPMTSCVFKNAAYVPSEINMSMFYDFDVFGTQHARKVQVLYSFPQAPGKTQFISLLDRHTDGLRGYITNLDYLVQATLIEKGPDAFDLKITDKSEVVFTGTCTAEFN